MHFSTKQNLSIQNCHTGYCSILINTSYYSIRENKNMIFLFQYIPHVYLNFQNKTLNFYKTITKNFFVFIR